MHVYVVLAAAASLRLTRTRAITTSICMHVCAEVHTIFIIIGKMFSVNVVVYGF